MTEKEIDRKLFELCKPEPPLGKWQTGDDGRYWVDDERDVEWSPSTDWSDLAPLIEKACRERTLDLVALFQNTMGGYVCHANFENGVTSVGGAHTAPTLPRAAALALISLLEGK